jgi:hypothetical protein
MSGPSGAGIVAAVLLVVALVLNVAAIAMFTAVASHPEVAGTLNPALFTVQLMTVAPFAVVGALLVSRRPSNPIGRLLLMIGLLLAGYGAGRALLAWDALDAELHPVGPAVLVGATVAYITMRGIVVPRLLLVIPNGRLPSPRWRIVAVAQTLVVIVLIIALLTPGELDNGLGIQNPLGIDPLRTLDAIPLSLLNALVDSLTVVCGASLVIRYRRADGLERSQLKLIAWVGVLGGITLVGNALLLAIAPWAVPVSYAFAAAAAWLLPIGIGIAVLRYRLYDIDRLISRTIGWAILTATLVGAFVVLVLGLQAVLAPLTGGTTVAVAASTLVVVALFAPIRSRVQAAVDRRFDRSRYNGELLLAAFGERLRDEVDLVTIARDLRATVDVSVRPAQTGLWLRERHVLSDVGTMGAIPASRSQGRAHQVAHRPG